MNCHNRVDSTQLDTQRNCDSVAAVGSHNHLRVCVPRAKHCKYVRACDIYVRSILITTIAAQQTILSASARYLRLQYLKPPQALLWIPLYPTAVIICGDIPRKNNLFSSIHSDTKIHLKWLIICNIQAKFFKISLARCTITPGVEKSNCRIFADPRAYCATSDNNMQVINIENCTTRQKYPPVLLSPLAYSTCVLAIDFFFSRNF